MEAVEQRSTERVGACVTQADTLAGEASSRMATAKLIKHPESIRAVQAGRQAVTEQTGCIHFKITFECIYLFIHAHWALVHSTLV